MGLCSCTDESKFYVGDVGAVFLIDACVNISGAGEVFLSVQKPDGTMDDWKGDVEGLTKIKYVIESGDFDQAGEYRLQAYVKNLDGYSGRGGTVVFRVYERWQ